MGIGETPGSASIDEIAEVLSGAVSRVAATPEMRSERRWANREA